MKTTKFLFTALLISYSALIYSQDQAFNTDINKTDIKTVLKAVADWQINTPLTHKPADWTNGALYAGMVEWAGIAGDDKYYNGLRRCQRRTDGRIIKEIILLKDIMPMIIVWDRHILNYTVSIRTRK